MVALKLRYQSLIFSWLTDISSSLALGKLSCDVGGGAKGYLWISWRFLGFNPALVYGGVRAAVPVSNSRGQTHAEKASLALGVAKHLLHGAVQQGVGALAHKAVSAAGQQRAAAFGLQQHVREQEEHLGLGTRAFRGDHV